MVLIAVKCSRGHHLESTHASFRSGGAVTCDVCSRAIGGTCATCYDCNFDLCENCRSLPQREINRHQPQPAQQQPVIQHCCMMAYAVSSDPVTAAARGERYNGRKPNYRGRRVSYRDYPDPEDYGWTFTGSCEGGRAEFFERDFSNHGVVKLDFYYTTGTVKTVLDHPRQGVTQLFAKGDSLSPDMYRAILQNPRHHTGNRYHRTR
ncbi:hypothetical protein ACHAWF_008388 [Thalassiosira exigua]